MRRVAIAACVVALAIAATWPVETRFGVDYHWSSERMPLYEKVVDFISRDLQTRRLVRQILDGSGSEQQQLMTLFDWVGRHVKPTPDGFPVVDDHPLHILIRGYGAPDQRTEAFALLASYAGMPATATTLKDRTTGADTHIAAVATRDGVHFFDVLRGVPFVERTGTLEVSGLAPDFSRMEMQKPWRRLSIEASKMFALGTR